MKSSLLQVFEDPEVKKSIKAKLPRLFTIAGLENSRGGQVAMQVGNTREQILIALLIWQLGADRVETDIPTTSPEVDVIVDGHPISIKTVTGYGGVKAVWTVDAPSIDSFLQDYSPRADILLAQIKWDLTRKQLIRTHPGGLFYIPIEAQRRVLHLYGVEGYLKRPPVGTNPRGVEFDRQALRHLMNDKLTKSIEIRWQRAQIDYDPYKRWVDYWAE